MFTPNTLFRLTHPQPGEENLVYKVVNYNDQTQRCIIECTNLPNWKTVPPQETVSINDIEELSL